MEPKDEEFRVKVVGIGGSLRQGSFTRVLVQLALSGAAEVGATTDYLDLAAMRLSFAGEEPESPADLARLRHEVRTAQGLILGTPEYHGSYSGVLKNALDLLSGDDIQGKLIGLVGVGGGQFGAHGALGHLRAVCRNLHGWVVPVEVSVPQAKARFVDGQLIDEAQAQRARELGREVARYAWLHHAPEPREAQRRWDRTGR